jgi:hypothetical protein
MTANLSGRNSHMGIHEIKSIAYPPSHVLILSRKATTAEAAAAISETSGKINPPYIYKENMYHPNVSHLNQIVMNHEPASSVTIGLPGCPWLPGASAQAADRSSRRKDLGYHSSGSK